MIVTEQLSRPLAYNTFGEFFNHIRLNLSIEDLQSVLYMYSKMIHDISLPPTIQVMSLKYLTNIAESIRQKASEKVRRVFDPFSVQHFAWFSHAICSSASWKFSCSNVEVSQNSVHI
jgi:hypothetical protein